MPNVWVPVEWIFGDIIKYFSFVDSKKNLKISVGHIGNTYVNVFYNLPVRTNRMPRCIWRLVLSTLH